MKKNNVDNTRNKNFWNRRNFIFGGIFLVILITISIFTSIFFLDIRFDTIIDITKNDISNKGWFLFGLIFAFFYFWFWNSIFIYVSARSYNVNAKWWEWILFGITIFFINNITPFSFGSEPYKIYWLTRHNVKSKDSFLIVSTTSIYWTILQIIITWPSFIIISTYYSNIAASEGLLVYWFSFFGMMLDIIIFSVVFSMSYSVRFHVFSVNLYNRILKKLKLKYKTKEEIINEYKLQRSFKEAYISEIKKWRKIIIQIIGTVGIAILQYTTVYFSIQLLSVEEISKLSFSDIFNVSNVAISANNFIPIPGAEGTIQWTLITFIKSLSFFNVNITDNAKNELNQAIFVWRSFLFYLPTIIGLLFLPLTLYKHVRIEKILFYKKEFKK